MTRLTDLSLLTGWLPVTLTVLGVLGAVWLLIARSRRYVTVTAPIVVLTAAVFTTALYLVVEEVWRPLSDPIAVSVYVLIGIAVAAVLLVVPRILVRRRVWTAVVTVLAAAAVLVAVGVRINLIYASYPTVGTVFGVDELDHVAADQLTRTAEVVTGRPLTSVWHAPAGLPAHGKVLSASIPPTASGFEARDAQIYLPPAYFADPRPLLPVLVLLAGNPGAPEDWFVGGRLARTMDEFAAAHEGLAPVVVVADGTGSQLANPLCLDSRLGNVATYLAVDVPAWTRANLQIDPDPRAWAVGGLSYGGTCSLQLATNCPQVYPTFLDLSGQDEPTLGDRQRTVDAAFGGDTAALLRVNPLDLLRTQRFPDSAGAFVVGADDAEFRPQVERMYQAARDAGMDVRLRELPGGHDFALWSAGLRDQLPWLATRLGITP
ncbi:esterase [Nocardia asteroides NBRC 15531]|uniref:Esterase n=1 Tax=Nocardia asteroides NBRC 15531 TaxID=1110697 RepID=U5EFC4_NOCAS|nr:alpha/beta hydrolase-fold protein [Nocardia asteroides]TLF69796.1 esterase [Nocardia asteroides NBRC 15531]UGT49300.1 esterase family protein [Nocardia asteroides]SFL86159.1 Enterochelin esterase [Nocardia asteroides]VEG38309.1 Endo-1,4-beta-xylanase Z precursor [Nocardia asteroides]GAD83884.1 putative esterase [Nocardia asteroides NBRC 15531]